MWLQIGRPWWQTANVVGQFTLREILLLETDILSKNKITTMDADGGVWDLDELNAVDMQLASTPKAKKLSQRKKRGSLMSRIENQTPSKVEIGENAAYENIQTMVHILG